jgi:hypothetical protein
VVDGRPVFQHPGAAQVPERRHRVRPLRRRLPRSPWPAPTWRCSSPTTAGSACACASGRRGPRARAAGRRFLGAARSVEAESGLRRPASPRCRPIRAAAATPSSST